MAGPHTRLYRIKSGAQVAGVSAGIADYYGIGITWVRLGWLAFLAMTGGAGIAVYILLVLVVPMRDEPDDEPTVGSGRTKTEEKKFWQSVRKNPRRVSRAIRARMREIDRRLADAEAYLTSPDKRLAREIDSLR